MARPWISGVRDRANTAVLVDTCTLRYVTDPDDLTLDPTSLNYVPASSSTTGVSCSVAEANPREAVNGGNPETVATHVIRFPSGTTVPPGTTVEITATDTSELTGATFTVVADRSVTASVFKRVNAVRRQDVGPSIIELTPAASGDTTMESSTVTMEDATVTMEAS